MRMLASNEGPSAPGSSVQQRPGPSQHSLFGGGGGFSNEDEYSSDEPEEDDNLD
jgi:hypothetical protein